MLGLVGAVPTLSLSALAFPLRLKLLKNEGLKLLNPLERVGGDEGTSAVSFVSPSTSFPSRIWAGSGGLVVSRSNDV